MAAGHLTRQSYAEARLERLRYLQSLHAKAARIRPGVAKYYDDPLGFLDNCIDWRDDSGPTDYQREIIGAFPVKKREAVRSPHGAGKSGTAAWVMLWFALTRDAAGVEWKGVATAGAWRQLINYLFPELHKWAARLRWDVVRDGHPFTKAELLNLNLRLRHGALSAAACTTPALIEGAHADSLLFIYDEAKAIPAGTFDACEGAFSGAGEGGTEAFALALSTPGPPQGRFYDICKYTAGYEDWHPVHVTLEDAMAAGRITAEWADQRARQWGTESAIYQNRVLGEFYASDEDSVIPLAWAEAAVARWHAWDDAGRPDAGRPRTVGVDVARTGQDRTVLALRNGPVITELRRSVREDTMKTTGRTKGVLDADGACTAVVDVIGIGAGVVDRLREQHAKVVAFNAAGKSRAKDSTREFGFTNKRSESYWKLREALDPSSDPDICLPDDEMLLGDLSAPRWWVTSGARIQVESKEDIHKRIGRSTDDGDAVTMAFSPHLGEHVPNARPWAGAVELQDMGQTEDSKMRRRLRGAHGGAYGDGQTPESAPWDLDGFSPEDDDGRAPGEREAGERQSLAVRSGAQTRSRPRREADSTMPEDAPEPESGEGPADPLHAALVTEIETLTARIREVDALIDDVRTQG